MDKYFFDKLCEVEKFIELKKPNSIKIINNHKNYRLKGFTWSDKLKYKKQNIPDEFKDIIYNYHLLKENIIHFKGKIAKKKYVKITRNQIMILDALMIHGGYIKKYSDNTGIYRNSEHNGLLDFNNYTLNKIIVAGNTNRVDRGDEEIYLPNEMPESFEFEYMFHTHPPTPKVGGRAKYGILYEFPSAGDILYFIDHFNEGNMIGSLVMTPEGLYNIRKNTFDKTKIKINENEFFKKYKITVRDVQNSGIEKYGSDFNSYKFYSKIANDYEFINNLNNFTKLYGLTIDFYPRIKIHGKWVVDDVYLPLII